MATQGETLKELVDVLREDLAIRTDQLEKMNELLEQRNAELAAQVEKKMDGPKWFAGATGVLALVIGAWVFSIIMSMVDDMNDMRKFMQNMGGGDSSYMARMANDMQGMSGDMGAMRTAMDGMSGDMGEMNTNMASMTGAMGHMTDSMGTMTGDMSKMNRNVGQMTHSVGNMSGSVARMNQDTNIMRKGVTGMSRDTHFMGEPFRAMDSIMPW